MSDLITSFKHHASDDSLVIVNTQDVEPYLEENKLRREARTVGKDWKHKWHLPNVFIEKFFLEYTGGVFRPMNEEFYRWVDKKVMSDPDLSKFRTNDPTQQFFMGYRK